MQDTLKIVIYGRSGEPAAEIRSSAGGKPEHVIPPEVDAAPGTEIAKYVNVIEAALALGSGTYTGTVAAAGRGK